jgi:hypothetical protein
VHRSPAFCATEVAASKGRRMRDEFFMLGNFIVVEKIVLDKIMRKLLYREVLYDWGCLNKK